MEKKAKMKQKIILTSFIFLSILITTTSKSIAFTRVTDLVFDGMSVQPEELQNILQTIQTNKIKNKKRKKQLPDKFFIINAGGKFSIIEIIRLFSIISSCRGA